MRLFRELVTAENLKKTLPSAAVGAGVGAAVTGTAVAGGAGVAAYFARQVVVPPKRPVENVKILAVGYDSYAEQPTGQPTSVRLPASLVTVAPGEYGLYFNGGQSFAVLGEVLAYHPDDNSVVRRVKVVRSGDLAAAARARISGSVYRTPEEAGYAAEDVSLELEVGSAPAWVVHPQAALDGQRPSSSEKPQDSATWAIMVHGMGSTRAETLRALEATQSLGMTSLHISYRTDREAPSAEDGRYGLGFTEWEDVDTAIAYALDHGARDVVLFGWSMGAAICLQAMDRGRYRDRIRAMVLDGPAVDWLNLIQYHGQLNKIPLRIGQLGVSMISTPALNFFTGLKRPIDLGKLSWTRRPEDISVPTLIIHSLDDSFVPPSSSQELAVKSPLVDFVAFHGASHTREWNVDPQRWRDTVVEWLSPRLSSSLG